MRLSDVLNSSDIDTLRRIAESYKFDCSRSSKNALMQEIMSHFHNRSFLARAFAEIKEQTFRDAVSHLMLDNRQEFSREEVLAMVKRAAGDLQEGADQKWMQRLLGEGWLFRLHAKGGRQFYFIPDDLRRSVRDHLAATLREQVVTAAQPPIVYRDEQTALARDAVVFLQYIGKHDVRITKDGTILKRRQQELFALLEIQEEALGRVQWRFGFGRRFHDYPDRFALLYDYCYARGLIVETEGGALVPGDGADAWCKQPEKERLQDLFRYWRLLYRRPIPRLKLCIATLAQAAKDAWVHVDSMNHLLSAYVQDYYYEKAQTVMEYRIYNMLVHLGLLAFGQLADSTSVIKVTALGRELLLQEEAGEEPLDETQMDELPPMPLIVQPNFDILVPLASYERIAWELDEITEWIKTDTMRVNRMTKASVLRAFDLGWTAETVLDFLRQETGDMVPGNVERMIMQWEAEFRRVELSRTIVVDCKEATLANDLLHNPRVTPHLRQSLSATSFLLEATGLSALQEELRRMGYAADCIRD